MDWRISGVEHPTAHEIGAILDLVSRLGYFKDDELVVLRSKHDECAYCVGTAPGRSETHFLVSASQPLSLSAPQSRAAQSGQSPWLNSAFVCSRT